MSDDKDEIQDRIQRDITMLGLVYRIPRSIKQKPAISVFSPVMTSVASQEARFPHYKDGMMLKSDSSRCACRFAESNVAQNLGANSAEET